MSLLCFFLLKRVTGAFFVRSRPLPPFPPLASVGRSFSKTRVSLPILRSTRMVSAAFDGASLPKPRSLCLGCGLDIMDAEQLVHTQASLVEDLKAGNVARTREWLDKGASVDLECLLSATESGSMEAIDFVLSFGSHSGGCLDRALRLAVKKGYRDVVQRLIKEGATDFESALMYAVLDRNWYVTLDVLRLCATRIRCFDAAIRAAHDVGQPALANYLERMSKVESAEEREGLVQVYWCYVAGQRETMMDDLD